MNNAFVFPGQASQYVGMGKDLYNNFRTAKDVVDEVDEALSIKISKIMFEGPEEDLTQTENAQVAIMATSMAILRVLEELAGLKYKDMCIISAGHSLGQYSSMCAGGCFSIADCAKILRKRGEFMRDSGLKHKGSMAAVIGASTDQLNNVIQSARQHGTLQIANDNSNSQKVISGQENAVDFAVGMFKELGIKSVKLRVSSAFHSELMREASENMSIFLRNISINDSELFIVDNVSLKLSKDGAFLKESLIDQIPGTVLWRETMDIIASKSERVVEIGPGKVLTGLFRSSHPDLRVSSICSVSDIETFCKESR
ncbi:MAG: ACP S-malonyltransferase [Alphaproteobacteria bacterium]|nr:ACP S-malonyltransferase [Alphaproteobacteria bacterium]